MGVFVTSSAHAHLMPRNHGTLNVTNGKAYIVLALPISVFSESEAQAAIADGVLTPAELKMESQRESGDSERLGPVSSNRDGSDR